MACLKRSRHQNDILSPHPQQGETADDGEAWLLYFQAKDLETWGKENFNKLIFIKITMRGISAAFHILIQEDSTNPCVSIPREKVSISQQEMHGCSGTAHEF